MSKLIISLEELAHLLLEIICRGTLQVFAYKVASTVFQS